MSAPTPQTTTRPDVLVGPRVDAHLGAFASAGRFFRDFWIEAVTPPYHVQAIVQQCYEIGVRSLPLISLTGFITGIVFTQQSRPSLAAFGATSWLASLVTLALVRSLAPLVTALICAGRVGSSIGAELGSMKVGEQIEAMEVSAVNPYKFLVVTRTVATTLMVPALMCYFAIVGLAGAFLNVHANEDVSLAAFLQVGFSTVTFLDLGASVFRALVFGFTIGLIACYQGFHAEKGTQGVGRAANASVVTAIFVVFIEEVLIVQLVAFFRGF